MNAVLRLRRSTRVGVEREAGERPVPPFEEGSLIEP